MKSTLKSIFFSFLTTILITSCTDDEIQPPVISNIEVGAAHDEGA